MFSVHEWGANPFVIFFRRNARRANKNFTCSPEYFVWRLSEVYI